MAFILRKMIKRKVFICLYDKLKYSWHSHRYGYNLLLIDGCLDESYRDKLRGKVAYHERKLDEMGG
ncbi:hypothetical protein GCM10010916_38530 [Paenibacillus abyssi]|uniref:Uncharacterized protein n=1 Tax=Paenibacillus abyssi TaxID=1340531 RepID=A0A917G1E5_9BACL|nr:hypothetical protein GCM10010916_38530 [Paenibacillus abyssi]